MTTSLVVGTVKAVGVQPMALAVLAVAVQNPIGRRTENPRSATAVALTVFFKLAVKVMVPATDGLVQFCPGRTGPGHVGETSMRPVTVVYPGNVKNALAVFHRATWQPSVRLYVALILRPRAVPVMVAVSGPP
jgi:hypothetical protein